MTPPGPAVVPMCAPASTPVALFASDMHLQPESPHTARLFFDFLEQRCRHAQQLYLLGDLFEYWAGDDDIASPFNARVASALRAVSDAGVAIFVMAGNRDFLLGEQFARAAGVTLLPDPSIVTIAGVDIVLTHGDAQCTGDVDYQVFRKQVRDRAWQRQFLAKPLAERLSIIARMREGSRSAQRDKTLAIMDVDAVTIGSLFDQTGTTRMIHGHTHRPALHETYRHGRREVRHVLPDWDGDSDVIRGGAIALDATGAFSVVSAVPAGL